ncbi:hypothetical protein BDR03DRAFT_944072 [Suillus americanus]|nr:hypothetical protein BDR03DRAFT_944072 [Suillus americanus]
MHFVRFFAYIAPCLSVARAFSVTVGTPTQCDPLTVSWTGGQPPFEIILTPEYKMYQNYSVPASAFSNGKGSYSISQLMLSTETSFLLTMSDATGFGSGGTTNELLVGNQITNINCNTAVASPLFKFTFSPPPPLIQCSQLTISTIEGSPVLPITIVQLIPGGQPTVFNSATSSYTFDINVHAGTGLMYFVTDSTGAQGGVSTIEQVSGSSNASCLTPSFTAGTSATATDTSTASPTSSSSSPSPTSSSSSSNVAIIAGAAGGGGGAVLIALVILSMCLWRKRRVSHSPDLTNSSTGNFAVGAPPSSFNQTQHSRQNSNTDFPVYGDARSSTMSSAYNQMSQPMPLNYPLQYPVGYPPPVRPGSQSPPLDTSTGNCSNPDFAAFGDARMSDMTPVEHMAVGARPASPLPQKTHLIYLSPPVQPGSQSASTSAGRVAVSNPPTPFNQTQNSRQGPDTDSLAVCGASGSQSMASASPQTAATAAGQTSYQPPTQIIVHTDADDIVPDANGVVELPPQYSEHRGVQAL